MFRFLVPLFCCALLILPGRVRAAEAEWNARLQAVEQSFAAVSTELGKQLEQFAAIEAELAELHKLRFAGGQAQAAQIKARGLQLRHLGRQVAQAALRMVAVEEHDVRRAWLSYFQPDAITQSDQQCARRYLGHWLPEVAAAENQKAWQPGQDELPLANVASMFGGVIPDKDANPEEFKRYQSLLKENQQKVATLERLTSSKHHAMRFLAKARTPVQQLLAQAGLNRSEAEWLLAYYGVPSSAVPRYCDAIKSEGDGPGL